MTFYPERGTFGREDFLSSEGALFDNETLQGITGGYVTLLSTQTGSSSIIRTWRDVTNWGFVDNLYSVSSVSGSFKILSGSITGQVNTVSGSYGLSPGTNAWYFETNYPTYISGVGYTGHGGFGLLLGRDAPQSGLSQFYTAGGQAITFEFDVASIIGYSGLDGLQGYTASGINLTGIPALTGTVGHGVLFSNGTKWDYIEITPFGIRSLNHPEIAIPIDLLNPRRVRLGFRDTDLFIATEDGRTVAGFNKFNTQLTTPPTGAFVIFGAPSARTPYAYTNGILTGITATVGYTLWDNIKMLTGEMAIYQITGIDRRYSTNAVEMYSAEFDPGISISKYSSATIGYVPYQGGVTIVTPQYSGTTGWTSFTSNTIPSTGNLMTIDLSSLPIFNYPRDDFGVDYLRNPVRFKVSQRSYLGNSLPPVIEFIELVADKERIQIDLLPDWKLASIPTTIKIGIESGTFTTDDPMPERWTSLLVNVPNTTGQVSGSTAFNDESRNIPITIRGTGEFLLEGPYKSCFQNYTIKTFTALSGSDAEDYFGSAPTYNAYPNPLFAEGFREVLSGEPRFVTGMTDGFLAKNTRISSIYTGNHKVTYTKNIVYRPENQARSARINSYLGRTSTPEEEFVQGVYIYPSANTHNGRVGIEAYTPSGIVTGNVLISLDLEIAKGSGLNLAVIGNTTGNYFLPGQFFRSYKPINIFTSTTSNTEFVLRFTIPSGYAGDEYSYNLDNLTVSSFDKAHLFVTGLSGYTHSQGITDDAYELSSNNKVVKASTVVYGSIYLDSYPASGSGVFIKVASANQSGLELNIDSNGFINAIIDQESKSWGDQITDPPFTESLPRQTLTSLSRVPLGTWTNIGFIHDVHNYPKFSFASNSGEDFPSNFTSTNRVTLTINGYPVACRDMMSGWPQHVSRLGYASPYSTYIPLTGYLSATIASGLTCKVDGVHVIRPPVTDVESELTIKAARVTTPYFVPDSLYNGGYLTNNYLYAGPSDPVIGRDFYIGSCYNFSSPGYTNWDRGILKNHLIFVGDVTKELNCPYSGQDLYSTRFPTGAYAIAPYSSAYERLSDTDSQLGLSPLDVSPIDGLNSGSFSTFGWIYPRGNGIFFTFLQENTVLNGNRLDLTIDTGNRFVVNKYKSSSDTLVYSATGQVIPISGWSFVSFRMIQTGFTVNGNTGFISTYLSNGETIYTNSGMGIDFGIRYQGRYGTTGQSEFRFGSRCDINLFNWVIQIPYVGETDFIRDYNSDLGKSGRYQAILENSELFTGRTYYSGYYLGLLPLAASESPRDRYFSIALHNSYDLHPRLNGFQAYDNKPFKEIGTYVLGYDTSIVDTIFGATNSPIRVGSQVPDTAINLAKFSSPGFTVPSSISVIDLSDRNINNLITYKNGQYQIGRSTFVKSSSLLSYRGINSGLYSGLADATISGQVLSADVEVTTIPITDPSLDMGFEAYYYYLIGRGNRAVRVLNAYPHFTGQLTQYSTGVIPDNYVANLEKIRSSIKLKNIAGEEIPLDSFPYNIILSPYTPKELSKAIASGVSLGLDNIGTQSSGFILPDGVFSVILLTHYNKITDDSVFVYYDSYDLSSKIYEDGIKEVVNPQPIFRERHYLEDKGIGKFDLELSSNNFYNLTLYGIVSGYSGLF